MHKLAKYALDFFKKTLYQKPTLAKEIWVNAIKAKAKDVKSFIFQKISVTSFL